MSFNSQPVIWVSHRSMYCDISPLHGLKFFCCMCSSTCFGNCNAVDRWGARWRGPGFNESIKVALRTSLRAARVDSGRLRGGRSPRTAWCRAALEQERECSYPHKRARGVDACVDTKTPRASYPVTLQLVNNEPELIRRRKFWKHTIITYKFTYRKSLS